MTRPPTNRGVKLMSNHEAIRRLSARVRRELDTIPARPWSPKLRHIADMHLYAARVLNEEIKALGGVPEPLEDECSPPPQRNRRG